MSETSALRAIRDHVLQNYLFTTDDAALRDDVSLMQTGVIDSTGILELIQFLQEKFAIEVADEEMLPENLDSVQAIAAFVARKASVSKREKSFAGPQ